MLLFAFVTSVRHSLSAGEYTTSLEVTSTDPFKRYQVARDRKLREAKARELRRRRRS